MSILENLKSAGEAMLSRCRDPYLDPTVWEKSEEYKQLQSAVDELDFEDWHAFKFELADVTVTVERREE